MTGTALYTAVSSALEKVCPEVTQTTTSTACSGTGVSIGAISYVADDALNTDGELDMIVNSGVYNVTSLRDAMIQSAALTMQKASQSKSNCYNTTYTVDALERRRFPLLSFGPRSHSSKRDHVGTEDITVEFCNSANSALVNYFAPWWRQAPSPTVSDFLNINFSFKVGPGGAFLCDFLEDLEDGLTIIAPEFAAENIELGEEIHALCEEALEK